MLKRKQDEYKQLFQIMQMLNNFDIYILIKEKNANTIQGNHKNCIRIYM